MIDYEKKQEGLMFGDLVKVEILDRIFRYLIFIKEEKDFYLVTDGKEYFSYYCNKSYELERIGSVMDKNIIDLIPKGESL